MVCARGQGMLLDNVIANSGHYNIEVRGEKPKIMTPEKAEKELEKKKKLYASMGLLVALPKDGVTIAGLITDESGKTSISMRRNNLKGGETGSVHMCDWSIGFLKENSITECNGAAIIVENGADPEVTDNTIAENASHGVRIAAGGKGRFAVRCDRTSGAME